jgi:hypothetical protein
LLTDPTSLSLSRSRREEEKETTDPDVEANEENCLEKVEEEGFMFTDGFLVIFSLNDSLGFLTLSTADCLIQTLVPVSGCDDVNTIVDPSLWFFDYKIHLK